MPKGRRHHNHAPLRPKAQAVASSTTKTNTSTTNAPRSTRFSLLLLDEGEYYGGHLAHVTCCPLPRAGRPSFVTTAGTSWRVAEGTLHLGSRSLIWEPYDLALPCVRLP